MIPKETERHIGENGQKPEIKPEDLLKGEVVFSIKSTLRELLKLNPGAINLFCDNPFDFETRDLGDSSLNVVTFAKENPFNQDSFLELLEGSKPGSLFWGRGQTRGKIEADWRIILPEVRITDQEAKRLYDFHKTHPVIGPYFREFEENHFENFWDLISNIGERLSRDDEGNANAVVRERHDHAQIKPAIIWIVDKNTGRKSYFCGKIPHLPRHDALAGQLLVSAYSPEQRDKMMWEFPFVDKDGRERKQQMLEAQSVLDVPMYEELFLTQSPVI